MIICNFKIYSGMGRSDDWEKHGFKKEDVDELNSIGYSGKTIDGERMSYEKYLNTKLNDGCRYAVIQVKFDIGDFREEFMITKVIQ